MKTQDDRLMEWLDAWRDDPATGHRRMCAYAAGRLLKKLTVPLEQVNPEMLDERVKQLSPSHHFQEKVLIAFRHFVDWCHAKGRIKTKPRLRGNALGTFRQVPVPAGLRRQVDDVFSRHRNRKTGDPLTPEVLKKVIQDFEGFYSILRKADSKRALDRLEDFTARDLEIYQQALETQGSLYKGKPMSPRTVRTHLSHLLSVFGAARKVLGWPANPMDAFELPGYELAQRDVYLHKNEVEKVCGLGDSVARSLREEFLTVRNITMARVQYDPALRPEEVVRLMEQEVLWNRETKGGLVPFIIRGAKSRPSGHEEVCTMTPAAVAAIHRYLEVRERYCAKEGIRIQPMKDLRTRKDIGTPLFITEDGRPMAPETYEGNFKGLVLRAGLDPGRITSYAMRHSRISHWLEDGVPIDRVSRLARHRDVNFTMKHYAHYQPDSDQHILEKLYGDKPQMEPILTKEILPERPVLRQILKASAELLGVAVDAGRVAQLEEALAERVRGRQGREELCYSIVEAMERLGLGRTQMYEWMRKGHLHPVALPNGRKGLPREEVDRLATLRSSKEASIILGYREKVPTTIQRNVREGLLKAVQLGNEYLFGDRDLADFLLWKNGHKQALGTRPRVPRRPVADQASDGVEWAGLPAPMSGGDHEALCGRPERPA